MFSNFNINFVTVAHYLRAINLRNERNITRELYITYGYGKNKKYVRGNKNSQPLVFELVTTVFKAKVHLHHST